MAEPKTFIFINSNAAKKGVVNGNALPEGYVYTAKFFGCGVIDRTNILDTGFNYEVLDPIAPPSASRLTFSDISDQVGIALIEEALASGLKIQLLWSGGIDSTVALTAMLKHCNTLNRYDMIEVYLSIDSINEYPSFYRRYIENKLKTVHIAPPVSAFLDDSKLIVTGELGDQLFGSDKSKDLVKSGLAFNNYVDVLPLVINKKLGSTKAADSMLNYLAPQIEQAPVSIQTAYEYLWWMNFSLKWQQVSLRIPVFAKEGVRKKYKAIRHFFRDERFQNWSLTNPASQKIHDTWSSYKFLAKDYIHAFAGDDSYRATKEKEPSLKSVLVNQKGRGNKRVRVYMTPSFKPKFKVFEKRNNPHWDGQPPV